MIHMTFLLCTAATYLLCHDSVNWIQPKRNNSTVQINSMTQLKHNWMNTHPCHPTPATHQAFLFACCFFTNLDNRKPSIRTTSRQQMDICKLLVPNVLFLVLHINMEISNCWNERPADGYKWKKQGHTTCSVIHRNQKPISSAPSCL